MKPKFTVATMAASIAAALAIQLTGVVTAQGAAPGGAPGGTTTQPAGQTPDNYQPDKAKKPDKADEAPSAASKSSASGDIVQTAAAAGNFNTLLKAVTEAGLTDGLKGKGPFTLFAPTDEAFAKLPPGALDELLKDKSKLSDLLRYHVVPGAVMAKDVKAGKVRMANGKEALVGTTGGVTIDGASVVKPDIQASNGVIHVIDTVIMPK